MKFIFYLLFLFQGKTCKPEIIPTSESINLIENGKTKVNNSIENEYFINSIDNNSIGKKIDKVEEIKNLKEILSHSLEREIERPYMWDVFVSSNDTLLHFFHYKKYIINNTQFASYYIKINYEDALYQGIMLINEDIDKEYNNMLVYENLDAEEKYSKITKVSGDKVILTTNKPNYSQDLTFQVKDGAFLDYLEVPSIDKKWKDKGNSSIEYKLKGKINNHLKNGYWIEKRYSVKYNKSIIEDGNYTNGLREGEWNYSPEGPVDMIKIFDKGKVIKTSYR